MFSSSDVSKKNQLSNTSFFCGLSAELQNELLHLATVRTIKKNGHLFMEGDAITTLYWIIEGKVQEYYSNCLGDGCLRQIVVPNNFVSLHKIFDDTETHNYSSEALTLTICACWNKKSFLQLVSMRPELAKKLLGTLACYMEIQFRQSCICRKSLSVPRVAGYLLSKSVDVDSLLAGDYEKPRLRINIRPLATTATLLCLSRKTFSQSLSFLREEKIITMDHGIIEVIDIKRLKKLSGLNGEDRVEEFLQSFEKF